MQFHFARAGQILGPLAKSPQKWRHTALLLRKQDQGYSLRQLWKALDKRALRRDTTKTRAGAGYFPSPS